MFAEFERRIALDKERDRHGPGITVLAAKGEGLGGQRSRLDVLRFEDGHVSETDQGSRPHRRGHVHGKRERPFEPAPSLAEQTALRPEPEERAGEFDGLLAKAWRGQGTIERRADVLLLYPDSLETLQLTMVAEDVQYSAELVEEVFEMPLAQPVGSTRLYASAVGPSPCACRR